MELLRSCKGYVLTIVAGHEKEFVPHGKVVRALKYGCYFAHSYSSWERGLSENANGLLNRRPKKAWGYAASTEYLLESHSDKIVHFRVESAINKPVDIRLVHEDALAKVPFVALIKGQLAISSVTIP